MTISITSEKAFITRYLVEHIQKQQFGDQQNSTFQMDSIVGDCFTELVRLQMREIAAENSDLWYWGGGPLERAIQQVFSNIDDCSPDFIEIDFSEYKERTQEKLEVVEKKISALQVELRKTRRQENYIDCEQFTNDAGVPFEIISIGIPQNLEGLVLISTHEQECLLNLNYLTNRWIINGEWFPFELTVNNLTFVLDDDGTIFISTDNLPENLIYTIRDMLHQIAQCFFLPN